MQLKRFDAFEAFATILALVTALIQVNPFDVILAVTFLLELLRTVLTHEPPVFMVNPDVGRQIFSRLEPFLTVHTAIGSLVQMDHFQVMLCSKLGSKRFVTDVAHKWHPLLALDRVWPFPPVAVPDMSLDPTNARMSVLTLGTRVLPLLAMPVGNVSLGVFE